MRQLAHTYSLVSIIATFSALMAAGTSLPAQAAEEEGELEEVIVTAQRRAENLQDVPIAVSVFSGDAMRFDQIYNVQEIAERTPNFTMTAVNPAEPNYYIRGIGSEGLDSNAAGDPSVVMYLDGVYLGRTGGSNLDMFDLERVEVLRGPQGTLFGKNAVGGLVHLITAKPTQELQSRLQVTVGDYSRLDLRGMVSGPISDTVSGKLAFSSRNRDGYVLNETTGNDTHDENIDSARGALLIQASDDTEILITADVAHQDESGRPRTNLCDPSGGHCTGINPDPLIVNAITDGHLKRDVWGISAEVNWRTSIGDLTSLTAYREADYDFEDAFFSNPITPVTIESINRNKENSKQFSQELRLAGTSMNDRLDWLAGLYYLDEKVDRDEMLDQRFGSLASFLEGQVSFPQYVKTHSFAMFAHIVYSLTDKLKLTVGARQTWESKDADLGAELIAGGSPPPYTMDYNVSVSESWNEFTPKFVLDYFISDQVMLYGSISSGFKSGGFQGTASTAASAATPYDPETAWSYEFGGKTQWFDNRLRANFALFHTDHNDLQVSELIPACCIVIGNAADAKIDGFELEFTAVPVDGLQIIGAYSYLDAKFKDFKEGATADNSGNTLPRSPKNKVSLSAQYEWSLGDLGKARVGVDWNYTDKIFFEASNTPNEVQDSYDLWDARIAFISNSGNWEVTLWGKNLGDELVKAHIVAFPLYRQELVIYQPPRMWGVNLTWNY